MRRIIKYLGVFGLVILPTLSMAAPDKTQLAVWVNEAIVATYSYDYKNYLSQQRDIAKYFTAPGWIKYTEALNASKLPEVVQKNAYFVSAVATLPPTVHAIGDKQWLATMPLLVVYKNPQYQQKQTLQVSINFEETASGDGVRGLAISGLHAVTTEPACLCQPKEPKNATDDTPLSPDVK